MKHSYQDAVAELRKRRQEGPSWSDQEAVMSLQSSNPLFVSEETARVAKAIYRKSNLAIHLRDELAGIYSDALFADLYPVVEQAAEAPWRLALVTVLQFAEDLPDREAADAVRDRIDWNYLLTGLTIR